MRELPVYQEIMYHRSQHVLLEALGQIAEDHWEKAHNIAQSAEGTRDFDRLHAFLHRLEGDDWNANYWYKRCGLTFPKHSFEEEFQTIATDFLYTYAH